MDHESDLRDLEEEATTRDRCDVEAREDLAVKARLRVEGTLQRRRARRIEEVLPEAHIQRDGEVAHRGVLLDERPSAGLDGGRAQERRARAVLAERLARGTSRGDGLSELVDVDLDLRICIPLGAVRIDAEVDRVNGQLGVVSILKGNPFGSTDLLDELTRDGRARLVDERTEERSRTIGIECRGGYRRSVKGDRRRKSGDLVAVRLDTLTDTREIVLGARGGECRKAQREEAYI